MTKRKMKKWIKVLLIFLVVAMLVTANYFAVYWFTPYPRHFAWNRTPIESEEYFDFPDQVLFYVDGRTRILRDEDEILKAYDAFWTMLDNEIVKMTQYYLHDLHERMHDLHEHSYTEKVIASIRNVSDGEICMEWRYRQRRVYESKIGNEKIEYDAVMLIIPKEPPHPRSKSGSVMRSCYSLNGKYYLSGVGPALKIKGDPSVFAEYVQGLYQ